MAASAACSLQYTVCVLSSLHIYIYKFVLVAYTEDLHLKVAFALIFVFLFVFELFAIPFARVSIIRVSRGKIASKR